MSKSVFFVSGLPRAGSTLLMNLLAQNPEVHSTPSSGVHEILYISKGFFKTKEFRAMPDPETGSQMFIDYHRAGIAAAYDSITDRPVVADKSRSWIASINLVMKMFPNAKMLIPVRDVRGVLSSMEKKFQAHPEFQNEATQGDTLALQSIEGRIQHWLKMPPVGIALQRIRELVRLHQDRVHFVHFEDLTADPGATMAGVWEFLGMEFAGHDFENVEQYTHEHDIGWPYGDHIIRPQVRPVEPDWDTVLGPQASAEINKHYQWVNQL